MRSCVALPAAIALSLAVAPAAARDMSGLWVSCLDRFYAPPGLVSHACTEIINAGTETDAKMALAFYHRGRASLMIRLYDKAIEDFDQALRLDPNLASAFEDRGFAHLEQAKFTAAIADYDAALRIDPKLAKSLFGRGIARRRTGDSAGGDADIAAATAIDSKAVEWLSRYWLKP